MTATLRRARHDLLWLATRSLLAIGGRIPLPLLRGLGRACGGTAFRIARRERRRALDHLALALPKLDESARRRLGRANAQHLGRMLGEVAWMWGATRAEAAGHCEVYGLEHLQRALEAGRGAVITTAHCGNWEMLNPALSEAGIPMTFAVREVFDPRLDQIATLFRERFGTEVVPRGPSAGRRLARALRANRAVGLLIDQDLRDAPGVFVPFFGRPAWTPSGAAVFGLRFGSPLIPVLACRRSDGSHRIDVHPPLPAPVGGSDEERIRELTAAATAAIEAQIRAHPEQWVWFHRRWRTRPQGV